MVHLQQSIEVEGKTVEEAIKKGLKLLNAPRKHVKVSVVCEEKRGLFGMEGAKLAKVKMSVVLDKSISRKIDEKSIK